MLVCSPEFSICRIEILNCTFNANPLYQRYIQAVVSSLACEPFRESSSEALEDK
jgi:hypothetical protein